MSLNISRRVFLKRLGMAATAGSAAGIAKAAPVLAAPSGGYVGIVVDLMKCDGCPDKKMPRCVEACRIENGTRYPQPREEDIRDYWPQTKHEDWRSRGHLTTTLTPYNWTYIQKVKVEHQGITHMLNIQRRCMHCDTPTCAAVCPFGVIEKDRRGAVSIHEFGCMGGAKCRIVCPWHIPQRQAGVGIYLKLLPKLAGGGVMYKCDLCAPRLARGRQPACVAACRSRPGREAPLTSGNRRDMLGLARIKAGQIKGHLYGDDENGGTGTFYVSPVPFEKIEAELRTRNKERFFFPKDPDPLKEVNIWAYATLAAPVAAVAGAVIVGARTLGGENHSSKDIREPSPPPEEETAADGQERQEADK
jgi:Fe-S-cluster-containing dehydrogenase component